MRLWAGITEDPPPIFESCDFFIRKRQKQEIFALCYPLVQREVDGLHRGGGSTKRRWNAQRNLT